MKNAMKVPKNKLIYLASLYSLDSTPEIRQKRYEEVQELAAQMIKDGYITFSPITYNHPMAVKYSFPPGWTFWKPIDTCYLKKCDYMLIMIDKYNLWYRSEGIMAEIKIAKRLKKKIGYVRYESRRYWFEKF